MRFRLFARCVVAASVWLGACATPELPAEAAGADPVVVNARAVPLSAQDASRVRIGRLIYRGGVALSANDSRFGGWSDLDISDDGTRLTAISDRGFWLEAGVMYDGSGRLEGLDQARIGPLVDLAAMPQRGLMGDAEGLARAPDGSFFVSYERRARIWLYPVADPPFSIRPRIVPPPPDAHRLPANSGLESLARLPGGRLLTLTEGLMEGDAHVGWVGDGRTWHKLTYQAGPDFKPTGMARLPDGDILVLERRFTRLGVPGARIAHVEADRIRPGARLVGDEIALIEAPVALDNFEGIAARRGPRGETLVYLISDDNYFFLQRTLLLLFELDGD